MPIAAGPGRVPGSGATGRLRSLLATARRIRPRVGATRIPALALGAALLLGACAGPGPGEEGEDEGGDGMAAEGVPGSAAGEAGRTGPAGGSMTPSDTAGPAGRALAVIREYVEGYYRQFPEEAFESGYPDAPLDRLGDRSPEAMAEWEAREDGWLAALREVDPVALEGTEAAVPYAYARERLAASVERRACRMQLWNVSPTWTGWQSVLPSVFAQQPVGTAVLREKALDRARDVDRYLDTEVANLRRGVELGYTAPRSNVEVVLGQVEGLLEAPIEDSPFYEPAARADDPTFTDVLLRIVEEEIRPAIGRYRDYLRDEYRPAARKGVAVAENPDGRECYLASVRFFTSLPLTPEEIQGAGMREMERIQAEVREIGARFFGTEDARALLERVRTDPAYAFSSEEELLEYARAAVRRAEAAVPDWFGFVPEAEVVVKPFPAFLKRSGFAFYSAGGEGRPGTYEIGTYRPETISRAPVEATAFHETYPGHHLQVSVALERGGVHPVLKYFFNSGFGEGWALYTEGLAEEMGLYSSELSRLGRLSNAALRAARLVVDPGMHALGWSRERALQYMLEHTAESEANAAAEVDRYIAVPGQATAYMTGSLEIQRLRAAAEKRLGNSFDIKAFHDAVLADGTIDLNILRTKMERWIEDRAAERTAGAPGE